MSEIHCKLKLWTVLRAKLFSFLLLRFSHPAENHVITRMRALFFGFLGKFTYTKIVVQSLNFKNAVLK